jgi:DNA repair exonuclease SbcCD nuclease subunit
MIKILHCADLHLSQKEKEYSFSVLDEMISISNENKCRFLVFAGDTFDGFSDLENLKHDFRTALNRLDPGTKIIFIAGNHEGEGQDIAKFRLSDNDNMILAGRKPFELIAFPGVEFLVIPYRKNYGGTADIGIPEKKDFRIAVAHGTVAGMPYAGIDAETGAGCLDNGFFTRNLVDYAAMGHIHSRNGKTFGNTRIEYPGSSRIWRKGEEGEHGVNLIVIDKTLAVEFIPLESAGNFREILLPLSLDGKAFIDPGFAADWRPEDWINIRLSGIVEDENEAESFIGELTDKYSHSVRKLTFDKDGVDVLSGISVNPLARNFLDIMERKRSMYEKELWLKAREMGLQEIKNIIKAKA